MTNESPETGSNTTPKQRQGGVTGKGFVKGDPRINRKGRPKSFDALRALAQQIGAEIATVRDKATREDVPRIIGDHVVTNAEAALRSLMQDDPEKFLHFAYGKVPNPVELTGKDGAPLEWREVAKANGIPHEQIEAAARRLIAESNRAGSGGDGDGAKE